MKAFPSSTTDTDHPIIRGDSHRSPVGWKALEIYSRVAIELYALSDWSPPWDVEYPWRLWRRPTWALVLRCHFMTWLTSIMRRTTSLVPEISRDSSASDIFHCSGALRMYRGETLHWWTLAWIKWHVTWTLCLGASCSKAPEGEDCLSSRAFLCLFNFALFDNCGDSGTSSDFLSLVSGYELVTASLTSSHCRRSGFAPFVVQVTPMRRHSLGQNSSWVGMTAPFNETLFPGAALRTSGPPWSNTSLPGGEARVILWYE